MLFFYTTDPLILVRAIDYSPELGRIVVGTSNCDINELTETTTVSGWRGAGAVNMFAVRPARWHQVHFVVVGGGGGTQSSTGCCLLQCPL